MHRVILFVVLLAAVSFSAAATADSRNASPRPNVVIVVADDLGWRDIGYHDSDVRTPTLDRLAHDGVRLEQYYVSPTCSPTRVGILSGRNPSRFGVLGPIGGKSTQHLPLKTMTLPAALQAAGYSTHISGKWHLGLQQEFGPTKYGFDTSYGYLHGQIDPYTHLYKFGDRTWHRNDRFIDEPGHATDLITQEAVRVIESHHERPFFLYVAYSVPHHPLKEPAQWLAPYDGQIQDPWRKLFAASITHMDHGVGQIVAALDRTGQRDNTIFIFTSDNGGQRDWDAPDNQYNGDYEPHTTLGNNRPFRGWKGQLYEGGVRVPALVNWPGKVEPGVCRAALCELDWMPTVLGLTQVAVDEAWQLDGDNIWPQLSDFAKSTSRTFYWKIGGQFAVRHGAWKLIASSRGDHVQLFNIDDDPYEKIDQATEQPDRVEQLKQLLAAQQQRDQADPP